MRKLEQQRQKDLKVIVTCHTVSSHEKLLMHAFYHEESKPYQPNLLSRSTALRAEKSRFNSGIARYSSEETRAAEAKGFKSKCYMSYCQ